MPFRLCKDSFEDCSYMPSHPPWWLYAMRLQLLKTIWTKKKKKDCKLYHNSLSCQSLSYYLHGFLCRVVWACACLVAQSCPILRDNLHCSPPSPLSTVFSRLEWKISSSREATGVTNKVFHVFFQLMVMVVNEVVNFMSACLDHGVLIFDQTLYWMFLWGCILGNINI